MDLSGIEYLVVGAGLSGAVVARRLVDRGKKVAVVDKRPFVGGLCSSFVDPESGVECHRYGTHVLHSHDIQAVGFLSRFCRLNHYRHWVCSRVGNKVYPWPINLQTINAFFGTNFRPDGAKNLLKIMSSQNSFNLAEPHDWKRLTEPQEPKTFEEACIFRMGVPLYEAFVRGYSEKQWGCHPRELPVSLMNRIPVRFSYLQDFFDDPWQGVPMAGYGDLFNRLLSGVTSFLSVDFFELGEKVGGNPIVVYTGPLDRYFEYRFGPLPWRSVGFEFEQKPVGDYQGCAVVNAPSSSVPYIRVHEFKHLHPERRKSSRKTTIAWEYSSGDGEPAYPVAPEGAVAERYRLAASLESGVHFVGRLATYRYINMDQAVVEALALADRI